MTRKELGRMICPPACLICRVLNDELVPVDRDGNYMDTPCSYSYINLCTPRERASLMIQWDQYKIEHSRSSIYGK